MTTTRVLRSLFGVVGTSASLAAQIPVQLGFQLDATGARISGVFPAIATGTLVGGRGSVTLGPIRLSAVYREGRLRADSAHPLLVEGGGAVDVQLLPWLSAGIGPGARAYALDSTTQRRVWLAGRIGIDAPLVGTAVRTDLRLWRSFATSATGVAFTHVSGGEVGIAYWAPARWWIRLATTFDEAAFGGLRHERLTGLMIGAGIGR